MEKKYMGLIYILILLHYGCNSEDILIGNYTIAEIKCKDDRYTVTKAHLFPLNRIQFLENKICKIPNLSRTVRLNCQWMYITPEKDSLRIICRDNNILQGDYSFSTQIKEERVTLILENDLWFMESRRLLNYY